MQQHADINLKIGFAGGTILSFIANINADDIERTLLLSAIGATISFAISLLLKKALHWYRHNRPRL
jgi:hypothetical protein